MKSEVAATYKAAKKTRAAAWVAATQTIEKAKTKMAYSAKSMRGKTFIGTPLPNRLHDEFSRLCTLAGRSKAKELETAVAVRVTQLQQQERQGVIRGLR